MLEKYVFFFVNMLNYELFMDKLYFYEQALTYVSLSATEHRKNRSLKEGTIILCTQQVKKVEHPLI